MSSDVGEKRGPVEKTEKGWPINPIGVVALIIFGFIVIFLIARPLIEKKAPPVQDQNSNAAGGRIVTPKAGDIIRTPTTTLEISVDEPTKADKVQFWAKTYADGKWQMVGEVTSVPYNYNWQIPDTFKNKAIALTSHIFTKDGQDIKDPGGWREGIIILGQ